MATPNAQLEAALAQFAKQPGITPVQQAQLRQAVMADAILLAHLNDAATAGHLQGFAPSKGPQSNLVGSYDKASGIVTLPVSSLGPNAEARADLGAALRVQDMSLRFAHSTYDDVTSKQRLPITQEMVNNLQSTLNGSPVLAQEIKKAVTPSAPGQDDAPLRHFAPLSGGSAGGAYNGSTGTMELPPYGLSRYFNAADMTFVLGHEIQHSFNRAAKEQAERDFTRQIWEIARSDSIDHDYTEPIDQLLKASRNDEAKAQIAGWNALVSQKQQMNPAMGLKEMLEAQQQTGRVLDFVEQGSTLGSAQPRPGLTFNPDASLSPTPANVEAQGKYYFDKSPEKTRLGFHHDSDYRNYYGANAVGRIIDMERGYSHPIDSYMQPAVQINMARLGLREDLMERNGIAITREPDSRQPYYDTSKSPPMLGNFDRTDTPPGTRHSHEHVPVQPGGAGGSASRALPDEAQAPQPVSPANTSPQALSPTDNFSAYLDRMLAAAQSGDDATFRQMTQTLADLPPGREIRAEAVAMVDQQEQLAAQQAAQQAQQQQQAPQMQGPVMRM